jgi:hypothetical protein
MTPPAGKGMPPTVLCCATTVAAELAGLLGPPQTCCQCKKWFTGSPVTPDIEMILAAANAPASAARCASALASYSVPISIDKPAIAMMLTRATATSAMVTPRSRERRWQHVKFLNSR